MTVEYLHRLQENPKGLGWRIVGLSEEEIHKLEELCNHGNPFPKALREFLYLAGTYCYGLDERAEYGYDSQWELQERGLDRLDSDCRDQPLARPVYAIDAIDSDHFIFVFLDEGDDPVVHKADFAYEILEDSWAEAISPSVSSFMDRVVLSEALKKLTWQAREQNTPSSELEAKIEELASYLSVDPFMQTKPFPELSLPKSEAVSSDSSGKAEALMDRLGLSYDHILAIRFAVNVGISTAIVWSILHYTKGANPVLAVASMVAASDPQPQEARKMFRARLINSLVGCGVGLIFILIGGASEWLLPLGLAVTVLISSLVVRIKSSWLQAPITAAVVIGTSIIHGSAATGIGFGLSRVSEIFLACLVGVLVSWAMSKIWIIKKPEINQTAS